MAKSVMRPEYSNQPASKVQRSAFDLSESRKTAFDSGFLIPVRVWEALPGDVWNVRCSAFLRLATALFPTMDVLKLTVHFWCAPNRILWDNWRKFCGEREDPGDNIDFTVPVLSSYTPTEGSMGDYFGLPIGNALDNEINCLPHRMYYQVYNEHYRSQDLINSLQQVTGDGPDSDIYSLQRRGKRPDYFTTLLPSPQKGDSVPLPLGTSAPVLGLAIDDVMNVGDAPAGKKTEGEGSWSHYYGPTSANATYIEADDPGGAYHLLRADLSDATGNTIIGLRQSVAVQQHLELDARGGTRYPEVLWSQFGTEFQDIRYRPEYLGGGVLPVNINAVPNQSGSSGNLADLAAIGTVRAQGVGFTKAFDEHSYIMCIACVDADLTYQQGVEKMWSRSTRYDFFWPSFAFVGDQAVLSREIYADGSAGDDTVMGYSPRYEEYRTGRSGISSTFRSGAAAPLHAWHYAEDFASRPTLGKTFIESNPPVDRTIAVPSQPHFIGDFHFNVRTARPIPLNGVPGMTRL